MPTFDLENFTLRLIAETLFYDQEYGIIGSLSLIDYEAQREAYIVSFLPEEGTFLIEEATAWEADVPDDEDEAVAYALAVESNDYATYEIPEAAATAALALAEANDLLPSFAFLFEDEAL
jgi:hypothetical protein